MQVLQKIFGCILLLLIVIAIKSQNTSNIFSNSSSTPLPDSSEKLFVKTIIVKGNTQTKEYIILREISFAKGDSIKNSKLTEVLEQSRKQVYNTSLFTEVKFEVAAVSAHDIVIILVVKERWYIYPIPHFKPADRNFNEWIKTYSASLKRVNYGFKFVDFNLTGRRDQLRIYFLNGFSKDFSFNYNAPYSNKALTKGFVIGAGYSQKKEIAYKTDYNNRLLFYISDSLRSKFIGSTFYINTSYTLRKGFFVKHYFNVGFTTLTVSDSILLPKNNPNYLNTKNTVANIFEVSYAWQYVNVNNVSYSTKGRTAFIAISKRGLNFTGGINALTLEVGENHYFDLAKKWYSSIQLNGKLRLPLRQAYINQKGLGYGDSYLRGLEYFVIDGVVTGLVKSTLKKKILDTKFPVPFKIRTLSYIPLSIYVKTFADLGYAYNSQEFSTRLNNRLLYTGGFGIDILTFYDLNLRLEYSFNQLNEKGLFLHTQSGF